MVHFYCLNLSLSDFIALLDHPVGLLECPVAPLERPIAPLGCPVNHKPLQALIDMVCSDSY